MMGNQQSLRIRVSVAAMIALATVKGPVAAARDLGVPTPSYDEWIGDVLGKLDGDEADEQRKAAEQLSFAIPYPPERARVLAALRPHLNGSNNEFRLRAVTAYAHWATPAQAAELARVVNVPADPPQMSGVEPCWAAAVTALVTLDPAAAAAATDRRKDDFFFRADLFRRLHVLAAEVGPAHAVACGLLPRLGIPENPPLLSLDAAEQLLQSDSADDRARAAAALAWSDVRPGDRATVLDGVRPHLVGSNGRTRLPFVQAFAHWATPADADALMAVVAAPGGARAANGPEDCWAAATAGLARVDPGAAAAAVQSRRNSFRYRFSLRRILEPIAQGNGPDRAAAAWLLTMIRESSDAPSPPLPPGSDFEHAPTPADPTAPAAGGTRV
jgi:hypothetical protein